MISRNFIFIVIFAAGLTFSNVICAESAEFNTEKYKSVTMADFVTNPEKLNGKYVSIKTTFKGFVVNLPWWSADIGKSLSKYYWFRIESRELLVVAKRRDFEKAGLSEMKDGDKLTLYGKIKTPMIVRKRAQVNKIYYFELQYFETDAKVGDDKKSDKTAAQETDD